MLNTRLSTQLNMGRTKKTLRHSHRCRFPLHRSRALHLFSQSTQKYRRVWERSTWYIISRSETCDEIASETRMQKPHRMQDKPPKRSSQALMLLPYPESLNSCWEYVISATLSLVYDSQGCDCSKGCDRRRSGCGRVKRSS